MKRLMTILICILCIILLILCALCVKIFTINAQKPNSKEQNFINCYNTYVRETLENPETVKITEINEITDDNGGTLVRFTYEYTTNIGYKTSRKLEIVTSEITIDPSLITLNQVSESYFAEEIAKLNGKSAYVGTTTDHAQTNTKNEQLAVINLWRFLQANSSSDKSAEYDLDIINTYIKQP